MSEKESKLLGMLAKQRIIATFRPAKNRQRFYCHIFIYLQKISKLNDRKSNFLFLFLIQYYVANCIALFYYRLLFNADPGIVFNLQEVE